MEDIKRLMVHGPAGTGKTLIAQSKFNTIVSSEDKKMVAFVFTEGHN
jgi:SpoVK/Ycf46/Vps4 family AAA+-type ATPase